MPTVFSSSGFGILFKAFVFPNIINEIFREHPVVRALGKWALFANAKRIGADLRYFSRQKTETVKQSRAARPHIDEFAVHFDTRAAADEFTFAENRIYSVDIRKICGSPSLCRCFGSLRSFGFNIMQLAAGSEQY